MNEEEFLRGPLYHAYQVMRGKAIDYREAWHLLKSKMSPPPFEPVLAVMEQIESMLRPMTQAEAETAYDEAPNIPLLESEKEEIIQRVMNSPEALKVIGYEKSPGNIGLKYYGK